MVTVTAIGDLGFGFDAWGGDLSGTQNPTSLIMDDDKDVTAEFTLITSANELLYNTADKTMLGQNYPNPFCISTIIPYLLNDPGNIQLSLYNLTGEKVATLVEGHQEQGHHAITWNVKENSNCLLSPGLYFYHLKTENEVLINKLFFIL